MADSNRPMGYDQTLQAALRLVADELGADQRGSLADALRQAADRLDTHAEREALLARIHYLANKDSLTDSERLESIRDALSRISKE